MSSFKEDALSSDELRKRLYQTFKNKGVLDTLKVQLRNQLIQELKHPPLAGQEPVPRQVPARSEPLLVSVSNSIVADHLRFSGYEYTLSVFYPESGLCKNTVASTGELMKLLKISPGSSLHTLLSSNEEQHDKGFLINLLTHLLQHHGQGLRQDADTQTISSSGYGESLVEKMKTIDKEYENFISKEKMFSFQSQLAEYRKDTRAQMEAEMNLKMQHFKDVEIAKVRMEEKSAFNKEFENLKRELENAYERKARALMDREKNAIERLQKQQEIEEKNIYAQRQSVLREIETLRNRENELKMRMEEFEKTCKIHEDKVRTTEELLRRREVSVRTMEDTHDQRLKNEVSRIQLELKEDFVKRTEELTESEARNKLETARIQKEAAELEARSEDHSRACSELKRLQAEFDTAQQQISLLTQQKELLKERLETMSDYSNIKIERAELQGQLQLLRRQLEEAQEENRLLRADLTKPSTEQLALQMEVRRLQSARKLEEEEFENQKQVQQAQLQSEVEQCARLRAQLMEYEQKSQWMTNQVEDFKRQLQQTQKALENEVLCNPKPSLVDRSTLELSADRLVPPDIYVDGALLRAGLGYDDVCQAGARFQGHESPLRGFPDSDMEMVAEAKARIQELEKEAETLEEAYRKYQQRAVHSTISYMLPQRPLSPHCPDSLVWKQDPQSLYPHAIDKPKISHRPASPRTIPSPSPASRGNRNSSLSVQPRVAFSEESKQPEGPGLAQYGLPAAASPLFLREEELQEHGPSTLHSSSRNIFHKDTLEEEVVFPVAFAPPSPDRRLSPAPRCEVLTSADLSSELSPPPSPQLKSTARERSSPPRPQPVSSSSESSPQPEKISLEDLTGLLSEPGHIPELLLDTAVPLSEEAPGGPAAPHPPDLPEDPLHLQGQTDDPAKAEEVENDEERWEKERKERQERRQREQEEARDRELQELERLEKEMTLQEAEQPAGEEEEETLIERRGDEEQPKETVTEKEESKSENPLEKYMKMVLEAREKQQLQSSVREDAERSGPEARSLSDEKNESIESFSHKDEDDDFW
ncbi:centriole and centriolar satellite protein ofd1 [Salarias fasciatus]|uniref:centriole and centriolar satellite protein ofd1 n=1 Tax=Salarias fasciatus TaxID=181472 RepID=UPI00117666FB|nr:oral-facial-digital syndrome 1 protein [Salarias fasciatus]